MNDLKSNHDDFKIPDFFKKPTQSHLQFFILMLIQNKPTHGYELINMIEKRTFGKWKPSHSAIYNALNLLENREYIIIEEKGTREKKIFKLTEKGEQFIDIFRKEVNLFLNSLIETLIQDDESIIPLPAINLFLEGGGTSLLNEYSKEDQKKVILKFKNTLETNLKKIEELLEKIDF